MLWIRLLLPLLGALLGMRLLGRSWTWKAGLQLLPAVLLWGYLSLRRAELLEVLFHSLLLSASVTDGNTGEVHDLSLFLLGGVALFYFYSTPPSYVAGIFLLLVPLHRRSGRMQYYFGEGDLWILLFMAMVHGPRVFTVLSLAAGAALLYCLLRRRKEVWFVPFLQLGLAMAGI